MELLNNLKVDTNVYERRLRKKVDSVLHYREIDQADEDECDEDPINSED